MKATIQFKRGLKEELPMYAKDGEPLFCRDTCELYIGRGPKIPVVKIGVIEPSDMISIRDYFTKIGNWMNDMKGC